jgi:hypothetical protein
VPIKAPPTAVAAPTPTNTAMAKFPIHEMRGNNFANNVAPRKKGINPIIN